jgi:hypothetical protein
MDKTYNGHKNWNCWNVSLWIDNEYSLYKSLQNKLKQTSISYDDIAVQMILEIKSYFQSETTPDGAPINFHTVREHLRGIKRKDY